MAPKKKPEAEEPPAPETGTGKFHYPNGGCYEGEWKQEQVAVEGQAEVSTVIKRHGQGLHTENGVTYEGQFVSDVIEGQGKFVFASGASYEGAWVQGKYHGHGTYIWPDLNRTYEGEWHNGVMHGMGIYTDKEGHKWEGQFQNGTGPGLTHLL